MNPVPGQISYAGGMAPLVGSDLPITSVQGLPANSSGLVPNPGAVAIESGTLSFSTGNFTGTILPSNILLFQGGGQIEVDGGIPALGIAPGTPLVSGTLTNASFQPGESGGGQFEGVLNPALAAALDLPLLSTLSPGAFGFGTTGTSTTNGGFISTEIGGSVNVTVLPEPTTFVCFALLAGGGLLYARRRARLRQRRDHQPIPYNPGDRRHRGSWLFPDRRSSSARGREGRPSRRGA